MTASKNLLHVEIFVMDAERANHAVLVNTLDVSADDISFTPSGGVLRHASPLQDAVHSALDQRYDAVMGGAFALVIDGREFNDCHIDQYSGDSRFVCLGSLNR